MKIRTRGNQAFNVPNTEEGHLFVRLMRKFRNRGWYYRARGRGSRKEHGDQAGIPQQFAEWFAVYLNKEAPQPQANPAPSLWVTNLGNGPITFDGQSWSDLVPNQDNQFQIPLRYANPPDAIFSANVAQWSAQIGAGDPVAIDHDGLIYNAEVHGVGQTGIQIGTAIGDSIGSIGEGEARVPVRLDLGEGLNVLPAEPIPWPQPPQPVAPGDDTVELTAEEQGLLEEILSNLHNGYKTQDWEEEKQEIFDSLFEKLVD
jgi:hypothetical protein